MVILASVFAFRTFGSPKSKPSEITPTPAAAYKEIDSSVQATLTANSSQTKATLTISGLAGRFTNIEYELTYETDNHGTQGAFSTDPIDISGKDEFGREVELGTCSTGGKCTYDKGVRNFKLVAKFHASSGETFILRKEFPSI